MNTSQSNTEKQITISMVKLGVGFKGAGWVWTQTDRSTATGSLLFKPQSEGLSSDLSLGLHNKHQTFKNPQWNIC